MSYIRDDVSAKRKVGMVLTYAVLILFAILAIAPLLWLALNSFKTSQDYQMNRLGLPKRFFWQNYTQAWQRGHFGIYILNSIFYTVITTVAILGLSFMSGFAFAKINNCNTKWMYGSYVVGILMTLQSIMIPLFIVINQVGLYDTKLGVLIPYIGIGLPMGIYLATEFMKSIPNALVESAKLDGAGEWRIFFTIILPLLKSGLATIGLFLALGYWNDWYNAMLYMQTESKYPLQYMLYAIQQQTQALAQIASQAGIQVANLPSNSLKLAMAVVATGPIVIVYPFVQRYFIAGITIGSVKG